MSLTPEEENIKLKHQLAETKKKLYDMQQESAEMFEIAKTHVVKAIDTMKSVGIPDKKIVSSLLMGECDVL